MNVEKKPRKEDDWRFKHIKKKRNKKTTNIHFTFSSIHVEIQTNKKTL